jgi:hypothetical protein
MKHSLKMKPAFSLLAALLVAPLTVHAIEPTSLKTEFLDNPLGIDTAKPRFSWIVEDTTHGLNNVTLAEPKGARKQGKQRNPNEGKL